MLFEGQGKFRVMYGSNMKTPPTSRCCGFLMSFWARSALRLFSTRKAVILSCPIQQSSGFRAARDARRPGPAKRRGPGLHFSNPLRGRASTILAQQLERCHGSPRWRSFTSTRRFVATRSTSQHHDCYPLRPPTPARCRRRGRGRRCARRGADVAGRCRRARRVRAR